MERLGDTRRKRGARNTGARSPCTPWRGGDAMWRAAGALVVVLAVACAGGAPAGSSRAGVGGAPAGAGALTPALSQGERAPAGAAPAARDTGSVGGSGGAVGTGGAGPGAAAEREAPPEKDSLAIGAVLTGSLYLPLIVADEAGYFAAHG